MITAKRSRARHEPSEHQGKEPRASVRVHHHSLVLADGCHKLNHQLQVALNRKLFRGEEQSSHAVLRRAVVA